MFQATAFDASYSDSGLFGIYTIAQADSAGEVTAKFTYSKTNVASCKMCKDAIICISLNSCLLPSSVQVIKAAIAQIRGVAEGNVSQADIMRAKWVQREVGGLCEFAVLKYSLEEYVVRLVSLHRNQVKVEYLMSMESSESLIEEIGAQALNTAAYQLPDTVLQAIDAVTQDDVVKVSAFTVEGIVVYHTEVSM